MSCWEEFWHAIGGEKTFYHCRTFLCNFPTLHVFSLWKCVQEGGRGRERERAPITCFSQDDSSVCGKALHPFAFTFPHLSPFPNPSEGKNGTAGGGNYRTAGHLFSFSSTPRSTFLGRRSSFRISPTGPPPRRRRWMGRCEGCFVGVRAPLWYRFDDSSPQSPPYPYSHPLPFIQ